jgi:hypothetical protein
VARIASLQPTTSASATSRPLGSGSPVSALTRASVWKVDERQVQLVLEAMPGDA